MCILINSAVLIPLLGAFFSAISRYSWQIKASNIIATISLFVIVCIMGSKVMVMAQKSYFLFEIIPSLSLQWHIEPMGMLFALMVAFLWLVSTVYAIGYMEHNKEKHLPRFFTYFSLAISCTLGIAFAGNLLTLFIFYELLTLTTYPLIIHHNTAKALTAGRIYLYFLLSSSIGLLLPALIWTWCITHSLDFVSGGLFKNHSIPLGLLFLFVYGTAKTALMPMHKWLPRAMVAPTPVSALLHAVAVVKAGIFTLLKIFVYILGLHSLTRVNHIWITYIACFTIITASIIALYKTDLKERLAYSTISQLSYMIATAALATKQAITIAFFYCIGHAFAKITLFFAIGAIYVKTRKQTIQQIAGIGRQMPFTMSALTIGVLAIIGLPPTTLFQSKLLILQTAFINHNTVIIFTLLLSALLNAVYFLPMIYQAFFVKAQPNITYNEAPITMLLPMLVTACATIFLYLIYILNS